MKRAINIFSPNWEEADSYGRLAAELATGLEARGYHVNRFGDGAPDKQFIQPTFGGLFLGYPTLFSRDYERLWGIFASMGPRVAITMFESDKLLPQWAEGLNRCDAVIVPTPFWEKVFRDNGVHAALHSIPLGISQEFFSPKLRTLAPSKPLTFLAIADRGARKAWDKAGFAFEEAFGQDMRYKLILKSRWIDFEIDNPNIEQIGRDMSNAELAELYQRADVMIFPSSGEGFGLPPREFAATGGIALATDWGGTAHALRSWGVALPYKMALAWRDKPQWYGKQGYWAEANQDELVMKLRRIADYFPYFAQDAMKAANFVKLHYQWSTFVDGVEAIWKKASEVQYASTG